MTDTLCAALMTLMPLPGALGYAAAATYEQVENWAQLPQGIKWSSATGVAIDAHGTIYVHHRPMPIMAFDGNGRFLRAWGQGMFLSPHFLRTDPSGNIWVTDRGLHQIFKVSAGEGRTLDHAPWSIGVFVAFSVIWMVALTAKFRRPEGS